jgi:hypothetical protein
MIAMKKFDDGQLVTTQRTRKKWKFQQAFSTVILSATWMWVLMNGPKDPTTINVVLGITVFCIVWKVWVNFGIWWERIQHNLTAPSQSSERPMCRGVDSSRSGDRGRIDRRSRSDGQSPLFAVPRHGAWSAGAL